MTKRIENTGAFKRVMLALVVLLVAATLMVGAVSAANPDGSEDNPIQISTYEQFVDYLGTVHSNPDGNDKALYLQLSEDILYTAPDATYDRAKMPAGYNVSLDLAGFTIDVKSLAKAGSINPALIWVGPQSEPAVDEAHLTIIDSSVAKTGGIKVEDITQNLEGSGASIFYVAGSGKLTINDGKFTASNFVVSGHDYAKFPKIIINGGSFESLEDAAFYLPAEGGEITFNGGTVKGLVGIDLRSGVLTINKSTTITATGAPALTDNRQTGKSTYSGAAVGLTKQPAYEGATQLILNGGQLISEQGNAILNYINATDGSAPIVKIGDASLEVSAGQKKIASIAAPEKKIIGKFTDLDGNILIYQGLNVTSDNDGATDYVKWEGDKVTIAALDSVEYRQYDDITVSKMKFTGAATYNGTDNQITLTTKGANIAIDANQANIILTNLSVVGADDATFGTAISLGSSGTLKYSSITPAARVAEKENGDALSSIAVYLNGPATIEGNTIFGGHSEGSSSQCIVVTGDAMIKNNFLITGSAKADEKEAGKTSSGSIAVRLSKTATATIKENVIISADITSANMNKLFEAAGIAESYTDEEIPMPSTRHVAFAIDGSAVTGSTINANQNIILLADNEKVGNVGGYGAVVYLNIEDSGAETAHVNLKTNYVLGSTYVIYADDGDKVLNAEKALTLDGEVSNNYFGSITTPIANHTLVKPNDGITWYTGPTPISTPETEEIIPGQINLAGNYWAWSVGKSTPSGYWTSFADAEAAKEAIGVADQYPLVDVNDNPTITVKEVSNMSIELTDDASKLLTAELAGTTGAEFYWKSLDTSIITLYKDAGNGVAGESLGENVKATGTVYKPVAEGTTQIIVNYSENKDISAVITITVYKTTGGDSTVGTVADSDLGVKITTDDGDIVDAAGAKITAAQTAEAYLKTDVDGVQIKLSYDGYADVTATTIDGSIAKMSAEYAPSSAPASQELPDGAEYALSIELIAANTLKNTVELPIINPEMNSDVVKDVTTDNGYHKPLAMITATFVSGTPEENAKKLGEFNANITGSGITLTFFIEDETGALKLNELKLKVLHVNSDGISEATILQSPKYVTNYKGTEKGWTMVVSGSTFSSYVLVEDTYVAPPSSGGSSSSGSSTWLQEPVTPTETPTEQPTDKPTDTVPTDIPSTQPTATPASPGFGILAALAGLGAVAALRRQ